MIGQRFTSYLALRPFRLIAVAGLIPVGFAIGCSSPKVRMLSDPPKSQVFVQGQGAKEKRLIGTTPFEITYKDLFDKAGVPPVTGEYLYMLFELKDYEPEKVLLPPFSFGSSFMTVKVRLTNKQDIKNASNILQRLHNAQKFAQAGQFERAHIEVDKALEIDPQFVRALSLKGSIYYLQRDFAEATKWFEKALAIDNSFDEAVKMISKIKQEQK